MSKRQGLGSDCLLYVGVAALFTFFFLCVLISSARATDMPVFRQEPQHFTKGKVGVAQTIVCDEPEQIAEILDANVKRGFAAGMAVFNRLTKQKNVENEPSCAFMTVEFVAVDMVASFEEVDLWGDGNKQTIHIIEGKHGKYRLFIASWFDLIEGKKPGIGV